MNLLGIRTKLIDLSGRFDLAIDPPTNYSDNGADFFIQAGQRYLDSLIEFDNATASVLYPMAMGDSSIAVKGFRAIQGIKVRLAGGGVMRLEKLSNEEFGEYFADYTTPGVPRWYSLTTLRGASLTSSDTVGKGISIFPPAGSGTYLILEGLVFSDKLETDTDSSYWSELYPDILIQASLYKMEQMYRNTQGARDYQQAVIEAVTLINYDYIQEGISEIGAMRDSW